MLHTLNFYIELPSASMYTYIFAKLKSYVNDCDFNLYPDKNNTKKYQCFKTHCFNDIGLSSINLCRYFGRKCGCFIELVVNCPKLIYNGNETKLAQADDYNTLEEKFNCIIQHLNNDVFSTQLLPKLNEWLVRRIDYAIDIDTPYVNDYISILKKGYIPKNFSIKKYYDTSFHIESKSCVYNFYNKTEELAVKYNIHINKNILRLEVQCKADKIRKIIKNYKLSNNNICSLWNESIAKSVIAEAINRIVGVNDFFSLNILQDKIYDSNLPKAYKHSAWHLTKFLNADIFSLSELSQIIESYDEHKEDVTKKILHLYKKRLTEKRFNKIKAAIKNLNYNYTKSYLNKINLSPIAIPKNGQAEYLLNPIKLFQ